MKRGWYTGASRLPVSAWEERGEEKRTKRDKKREQKRKNMHTHTCTYTFQLKVTHIVHENYDICWTTWILHVIKYTSIAHVQYMYSTYIVHESYMYCTCTCAGRVSYMYCTCTVRAYQHGWPGLATSTCKADSSTKKVS